MAVPGLICRTWALSLWSSGLAAPRLVGGGLSFPFKDWTHDRDWTFIPCIERWILNHWVTREVLFLRTFWWDQRVINQCDLLNTVLWNVSILEDVHNLVSQYFPNGQCWMLHNHVWVKNQPQNKINQMNFNVTKY